MVAHQNFRYNQLANCNLMENSNQSFAGKIIFNGFYIIIPFACPQGREYKNKTKLKKLRKIKNGAGGSQGENIF